VAEDSGAKLDKYEVRLTESVENLRSNAKWTLVAFGAIGTTLLAGSQLSSLGKFPLNDGRLWAAIAFAIVAMLAATAAVRSALKVANAGYVEFNNLSDADIRFVQDNPALLEGFESIENLKGWYNLCIEARFNAISQPVMNQAALTNAERWFNYVDGVIDNIMSYLHYNRIRQEAEESRGQLMDASIFAAISLLGFAWAANPKAESPVVVLTSPPSQATLALSESGKKSLAPLLGTSCINLDRIDIVLLSVSTTGSEVVTSKTKDCPLARFTITDNLGKLSPGAP
jgi:hypothetical protein